MTGELPRRPVRRPSDRHDIRRVRLNGRRKEENSVFDPSVDVQADVDAINRGEARRQGEYWFVNERRYMRKPSGQLTPVDGEGVYYLDRVEYHALGAYNVYGVTEAAERYMNSAGIPEEKRGIARYIHQREYGDGQ